MEEISGDCKGYVHKIETFGLVDGPGVRSVVFLSGCRMRCKFCHNPDTWSEKGEERSAEDVFRQLYRYKPYWKNNGGITISGGEPLLQIKFVQALSGLAGSKGIHTAIDTAGQPFSYSAEWMADFKKLCDSADLFILDLKMMDSAGHRDLTGVDNTNILEMAKWLSDHGKRMWIRHVLVPGITDDENDLKRMYEFISTLKTVDRVEILPYHTLGVFKWQELGLEYPLKGVPAPDEEQIKKAERLLHICV